MKETSNKDKVLKFEFSLKNGDKILDFRLINMTRAVDVNIHSLALAQCMLMDASCTIGSNSLLDLFKFYIGGNGTLKEYIEHIQKNGFYTPYQPGLTISIKNEISFEKDMKENLENVEDFINFDFKKYMYEDSYMKAISEKDFEELKILIEKNSRKKSLRTERLSLLEEHKKLIFPTTSFKYEENSEELNNLKNWMRYRSMNALRNIYSGKVFDVDEYAKELINHYNIKWNSQHIDNIFSVATLFYKFIRVYLMNHLDEFIDVNSQSEIITLKNVLSTCYLSMYERFGKEYRDVWILNNLDDIFEKATDEEKEVFKSFNQLCKYTHTFGNYMQCPDASYNQLKGFKFNDNIFEVNVKIDHYNEWFKENEDIHYLNFLKMDYEKMKTPSCSDLIQSKTYIDNCVEIIKERTENIYNDLIK